MCVAAGILRRGETVLVCRRRTTDAHPGKWEFPGGKIEPGESPAVCVQREVAEELGVEATIGALVAKHRHTYAGGPTVELWFFEVTEYLGELQNRVFAETRWMHPDALHTIDLLEADRPLITALRQRRTP